MAAARPGRARCPRYRLGQAEGPAPGYQTWQQVTTSEPLWSSFGTSQTWQSVEGVVSFAGLFGNGTPNEIIIQPRKNYSSSLTDQQREGADKFGVLSVAEVLRPAASLITVDTSAPQISVPVQIASAWADSQYWEIVQLVTPANPASPPYLPIANSYQGSNADEVPGGTFVMPKPPMSCSQGAQYSYASDVTTVTAATTSGGDPNATQVSDGQDFEVVVFPGGRQAGYTPAQAVMPPGQAQTARTASPVSVLCAPYSGPRVPVMRAS
jgi:hypothetical protein